MSHYLIRDGARRVMNEYLDLPGLSLTAPQAQRLFALDGLVCEAILGTLVDLQFLRQTREGR